MAMNGTFGKIFIYYLRMTHVYMISQEKLFSSKLDQYGAL